MRWGAGHHSCNRYGDVVSGLVLALGRQGGIEDLLRDATRGSFVVAGVFGMLDRVGHRPRGVSDADALLGEPIGRQNDRPRSGEPAACEATP